MSLVSEGGVGAGSESRLRGVWRAGQLALACLFHVRRWCQDRHTLPRMQDETSPAEKAWTNAKWGTEPSRSAALTSVLVSNTTRRKPLTAIS